MNVLLLLVWLFVGAGCILGAIIAFFTMTSSMSAPQEAVGMCLGLSFAVIPYCLARAVTEIAQLKI